MKIQRWTTSDARACDAGGFVAYGDYLELKQQQARDFVRARDEMDRAYARHSDELRLQEQRHRSHTAHIEAQLMQLREAITDVLRLQVPRTFVIDRLSCPHESRCGKVGAIVGEPQEFCETCAMICKKR